MEQLLAYRCNAVGTVTRNIAFVGWVECVCVCVCVCVFVYMWVCFIVLGIFFCLMSLYSTWPASSRCVSPLCAAVLLKVSSCLTGSFFLPLVANVLALRGFRSEEHTS